MLDDDILSPDRGGGIFGLFLTYLVPVVTEACLLEIPGEMLALESEQVY